MSVAKAAAEAVPRTASATESAAASPKLCGSSSPSSFSRMKMPTTAAPATSRTINVTQ